MRIVGRRHCHQLSRSGLHVKKTPLTQTSNLRRSVAPAWRIPGLMLIIFHVEMSDSEDYSGSASDASSIRPTKSRKKGRSASSASDDSESETVRYCIYS